MDRRTMLKGAAAAAGAPLASLVMPATAQAADTYQVAVCEQQRNNILIHPAGVDWTPANRVWRWTPPPTTSNTWAGLSDIKFRDTTAFGWVALVTASGGKVGIVDIDTFNVPDAGPEAVLWSARPYGNPHAIERIPGVGAIVTASADSSGSDIDYPGFLTVYGPADVNDPSTLTKVQEITYQGAHGLWYDGQHLWALGTWTIAQYLVTGDHLSTRLQLVSKYTFPEAFNGHSLDTDYSDPGYLLITGGGSVKRLDKETGAITGMTPTGVGVKSFSRVASGNSFWVQAINVTDAADFPDPATGYWNTFVQFFDTAGNPSFQRPLTGYGYSARFYRSRVSSVAFS